MTEIKIGSYQSETAEDDLRALLVGRTVVKADYETLELDNGVQLLVRGNDGCGGCPSGQYDVKELNGVDNAVMSVEFEEESDNDGEPAVLRIFVYTEFRQRPEKLVEVAGSVGNGYYGWGYYINVRTKEERGE